MNMSARPVHATIVEVRHRRSGYTPASLHNIPIAPFIDGDGAPA